MAPTCFVLMYEPQFHSSGNAHSNSQNSLLEQLSWMAVEVQAVRKHNHHHKEHFNHYHILSLS